MVKPTPSQLAETPGVESARSVLPQELQKAHVLMLLQLSLMEDLSEAGSWPDIQANPPRHDVTSEAIIAEDARIEGVIRAKDEGVISGLPIVKAICHLVNVDLSVELNATDGERVEPGAVLATIRGPGRALLTAERPALNFLGRCSGISTLTRRFVDAVAGTKARILDTRKTAPGARRIEKYSVRKGGGENHRMGLFDMVLIKDNHIDAAGSITEAVRVVRERSGDDYPIEVEVKDAGELDEALATGVSRILLDNMDLAALRDAVERTSGAVPLEASGNVTLGTVHAVASTGVDFISVGAITHSAPVLDVSLRVA